LPLPIIVSLKQSVKNLHVPNRLVRIFHDRSLREALFVFALTRTFVFMILILVGQFTTEPNASGTDFQLTPHDASISLQHRAIGRRLRETMAKGDINLYIHLAEAGYDHQPFDITKRASHYFAFFPLYPLLLRSLAWLTNDLIMLGVVLSNVLFLFALIILHKLVLALGHSDDIASRTIFYLATFPTSYFFSVPMSESLFLFLAVTAFYLAVRSHWLGAGVIGALCSASRSNGILLLPVLAVYHWQRHGFKLSPRKLLPLLLIPLGLLAYMLFSWKMTGTPWAFIAAQKSWGRHFGFFLIPLVQYVSKPYDIAIPWNVLLLNFAAGLLSLWAVYALAKRRDWSLALYQFFLIVMPLSTMTLLSLARYVSVFFPLFLALALATPANGKVDQAMRFVFVSLLALMTAMFAAHVTFAVA
jgi:Gpi18-like mannosyltransferase